MASRAARLALGGALALAGCGEARQPVALRFAALADGLPLACGAPRADAAALTDLRFYIHDVVLLTAAGGETPLTLDAAAPWQTGAVALVDLEDGQGACETGSPATHAVVTGHAAAASYVGVRFTLGVPFAFNHADPALAQAPLDQTAMHWHWQAGYKFLRAGLRRGEDHSFLHLGSTLCEGRIGAITSCAHPNRFMVTLAKFNPAADTVGIDLATLFSDTAARACQSEPDNVACADMFAHLGLGGRPQDVFRRVAAD
jgi:uncharacterized repeat protein (TIGR04052 family)